MPFDNPQPQTDPTITALGQMIVEAVNREANIRAQLIAAQAQIGVLTGQLAAATPPAPAVVTPPVKAPRAA